MHLRSNISGTTVGLLYVLLVLDVEELSVGRPLLVAKTRYNSEKY